MGTFVLYSIAIVVSGIMTVVSVVFTIISFAYSKRGKFGWLAGFISSLAVLLVTVFFITVHTKSKTEEFADDIKNAAYNNIISNIDTVSFKDYNFADSLNSPQIKWLKQIQPAEYTGKVHDQFYNYLGFRDYYRLPLRYPFSLHCVEAPEKGWLFNELNVTKFDESDNGEIDCKITDIESFVFDEKFLIGKSSAINGDVKKEFYFIYHFSNGKTEKFNYSDEVKKRAREVGFRGELKLMSCREYYNSL